MAQDQYLSYPQGVNWGLFDLCIIIYSMMKQKASIPVKLNSDIEYSLSKRKMIK